MIATGSGNLIYTITGTPKTSGIANFAISVGGQSCSLSLDISPEYMPGSVFCGSGATEIVDITSPNTGRIWMDRNIGASKVATSANDSSSFGDLYQWGRRSDGHQCRNSPLASVIGAGMPTHGSFIIPATYPYNWGGGAWSGLNDGNPCPRGYRVPTKAELEMEVICCGQYGGPLLPNSIFKFPTPGYRSYYDGEVYETGTSAGYWSSTGGSLGSYYMPIRNNAQPWDNYRSMGYSVRCIKDYEVGTINTLDCTSSITNGVIRAGTNTSNVSVTIGYTGGNGGKYNTQSVSSTGITGLTATLATGIFASGDGNITYSISGSASRSGTATFKIDVGGQICSFKVSVIDNLWYPAGSVFCTNSATTIVDVTNPTTGKIWMDRNLGATQAATSSTDIASYGDLYQWGRRPDGHQCRNSPLTNDLSSSDQPSNDRFILPQGNPFDWRSIQNDSLWQGPAGINNPCPTGYRIPTSSELENERQSWICAAGCGAFNSPLKLPMAGYRTIVRTSYYEWEGSLVQLGVYGVYWSSTVFLDGTSGNAKSLWFGGNSYYSQSSNLNSTSRALGLSVRCIKD